MGAVELSFATEPSCPKLHRTVRRNSGRLLLPDSRRSVLFARGSSSLLRRGQIISCEFAPDRAVAVDHSLHRVGCVFVSMANVASARLEARLQHSRSRRMGRLSVREDIAGYFDGQNRFRHFARRNLRREFDLDDWAAPDPSRSANRFRHTRRVREPIRLAVASKNGQGGHQRPT